MGIIENIKENIRDITQGTRDVIYGKPSTPYTRKVERGEQEFESKRVSTEVGLRERTTTGGSVPGTTTTYSGGRGGTSRTSSVSTSPTITAQDTAKQAAEQKAIEDMRKAGALRLAQEEARRTQSALRSKPLVDSLRAGEQIKIEAEERGRGFTEREYKKRLRELGTTSAEFKQASRASREKFKKTGVSVTEQIRLEEEEKRKQKKGELILGTVDSTTKEAKPEKEKFSIFKTMITAPVATLKEVKKREPKTITEATQIPIKAVGVVGAPIAAGVSTLFPEKGFDVTFSAKPEKEVSYLEPQFGTITPETKSGFIERRVTVEAKPERTVAIFERKRVEEGVGMGVEFAAVGMAPMVFAPGFVAGGMETALDKEKTTGQRALGVAEAGLGGFIVGAKAVKYLRTPVKITKAERAVRKPVTVEVQAEKIIEGKPKAVSTFFRATETRAPTITIETTRARELSRLKPKKVTRKPAEVTLQYTPKPAIEGKIFTVAEKKLTKPSIKITKVAQVSKKTPQESQLFMRGLGGEVLPSERLKKLELFLTKRIPSEKGVIRLRTGEEKLTTTLGISKDIKRIKVTPRTLRDKPILDSRIKGTISVSEAKQVARVKEGELFLIKGATKQITSAKPSPRGATQESRAILLKLKEQPSKIKPLDIIGKPTITPTKKPQILKQKVKKVKPISELVPLPEVTKVKPTSVATKAPKTISKEIFPMVSAKGITATQLETTAPEIISINGLSKTKVQPQVQIKKPEVKQKPIEMQLQPLKPRQRKRRATVQVQKEQPIQILKPEKAVVQKQKPIQQISRMSLLAKARADTRISQQLQPQLTRPVQPKPATPKPIAPIISPMLKRLAVKAKEEPGMFEIFTKKGGKDVRVARARTEQEAFRKLKKKLRKSLRASGYVKKGKKKVAPPILLNGEFRKSKVDKYRVVEKKGKRLRKTTTGKEIQYFRAFGSTKKKSKKKSNFFGF